MLSKSAIAGLDAPHPAALWVENVSLDPLQIDCVTAQMLAILDNHSKLGLEEQITLIAIYGVVKDRPGLIFDQVVHNIIDKARTQSDARIMQELHDLRLTAEQRIPKQIMRHFKLFLAESLDGFDTSLDARNLI
ncbi:MAG: hypothetical protein KUF72_13055 [Candidatus Thiodiazotropha sp. (ex Ctena orbiculata)]|nr:hypothetical protein [Candidatus Thiodiazotropha taylori]